MPRPCTVCIHPERAAIDRALVAGEAPFALARRYSSLSEPALRRHKGEHLPATLVQAQQAEEEAQALDVLAELRRCLERVNLLFDACDGWLRDPDHPERYDVGPRAHEVTVVYTEPGPDGRPVRHRAPLDQLLARLGDAGASPVAWEVKHADPRKLILDAAGQLRASLELGAKLLGELDERPVVNLLVTPEWLALRARIVAALAAYPEARAALAEVLGATG